MPYWVFQKRCDRANVKGILHLFHVPVMAKLAATVPMLKALLFDLDGTIANTDPIHFENWREIAARLGKPIDLEYYQRHFSGRLNETIVAEQFPQLTPEEGIALSQAKEAAFRRQAAGQLQPMPGLLELLQWMDELGLKRAAVTNAPVENVEFLLRVLNLQSYFPLVVLGDLLPKGKPDPMPYQVALEQLGIAADEAIAFEDSPSGIRSAVGADIFTVAIASTHSPAYLAELGASLVIPDFTDLRLEAFLRAVLQSETIALP